jgi:hypothetical protein
MSAAFGDGGDYVLIPPTAASIPNTEVFESTSSSGIRYKTVKKPLVRSEQRVELKPLQPTTLPVVPYRPREPEIITYQPQYSQQVIYKEVQVPVPIQEPPQSFSHDFWHETLRPLGLGVAAPVAGAGALVGGVVCGTGALVAGCAVGLASTVRGVTGLVPLATNYVMRPVATGIDNTAFYMDDAIDQVSGEEKYLVRDEGAVTEDAEGWAFDLFGDGSTVKSKPAPSGEWQLRRPVSTSSGVITTGTPVIKSGSSRYVTLPPTTSNVRSYSTTPLEIEYARTYSTTPLEIEYASGYVERPRTRIIGSTTPEGPRFTTIS